MLVPFVDIREPYVTFVTALMNTFHVCFQSQLCLVKVMARRQVRGLFVHCDAALSQLKGITWQVNSKHSTSKLAYKQASAAISSAVIARDIYKLN